MSATGEIEVSRNQWNSHNMNSFGNYHPITHSEFDQNQSESELSRSYANGETEWRNSASGMVATTSSIPDHSEFSLNGRIIPELNRVSIHASYNTGNGILDPPTNKQFDFERRSSSDAFNMSQMIQTLQDAYAREESEKQQKRRSLLASEFNNQFNNNNNSEFNDPNSNSNLHRVVSDTTLSAIPSFLYDAISSPSDHTIRNNSTLPYDQHQSLRNPQQMMGIPTSQQMINENNQNMLREASILSSLLARNRYSTSMIFPTQDEEDSYLSLLNNSSKVYNSVPPQGYICKLCGVEGHWLRNCIIYRERRQDYGGDMESYFLNNVNFGRPPSGFRLPQKKTIPPDGYICRKCNTPGHWIQQCTYQKISIPPDTYVCKICAIAGHWIYQCPQRQRNSF